MTFPRLADRCPNPDCERPATHAGYHEDSDGFRWRQEDEQPQREAAEDAVDVAAKAALR